MVFRRRSSRRSYGRRPRRSNARRRMLYRTRRMNRLVRSPSAHTFTCMTGINAVVLTSNVSGLNGTGFVSTSFNFKLSDLINSAEFTTLYDQFRILKATLYFQWNAAALDTIQIQSSVLLNPPVIMYHRDYDDNAVLTHSEFHERSATKYKRMRAGGITTLTVTPAVLASHFEGATATAYSPKWRQWLDVADAATPHYGMKVGFKYPASTVYGNLAVWYKLTVQFKGQR